jgi:hypothetical protein
MGKVAKEIQDAKLYAPFIQKTVLRKSLKHTFFFIKALLTFQMIHFFFTTFNSALPRKSFKHTSFCYAKKLTEAQHFS